MCFVRSRQAEQSHLCAKMLLFLHPRNRYTTDKSSTHLPQMRAAVRIGKGEFHMARVYNFSAGPSMLPEKVLRQAQAELLEYGDSGQSVMEMSHRSTFSGSILGPALKLYTRAIINLSFSCNTPITQHRLFCGASVTFRSRSIPVFPSRKQEHLCTKILPLHPA